MFLKQNIYFIDLKELSKEANLNANSNKELSEALLVYRIMTRSYFIRSCFNGEESQNVSIICLLSFEVKNEILEMHMTLNEDKKQRCYLEIVQLYTSVVYLSNLT